MSEPTETGRPPRRWTLKETGENRAPQRGEYYIDTEGRPRLAQVNFSSWARYPILRLEVIE